MQSKSLLSLLFWSTLMLAAATGNGIAQNAALPTDSEAPAKQLLQLPGTTQSEPVNAPVTPATTPLTAAPAAQAATLPAVSSPPSAATPLPTVPTTPATAAPDAKMPLPQGEAVQKTPNAVTIPVTIKYAPKFLPFTGTDNPQILEEPVKIEETFSLMFSRKDMETLVIPSLVLFDRSEDQTASAKSKTDGKDDLTGLLESLKVQGETKTIVRPLPHLFLGSIMYYSPTNWSVWINGKKLVNRLNAPANPLYVSHIDRTHIVLVWRPESLRDMTELWNQKSSSTETLPKNITVNTQDGSVTLTMRPNQTFVPRSLKIHEGMVIQ